MVHRDSRAATFWKTRLSVPALIGANCRLAPRSSRDRLWPGLPRVSGGPTSTGAGSVPGRVSRRRRTEGHRPALGHQRKSRFGTNEAVPSEARGNIVGPYAAY